MINRFSAKVSAFLIALAAITVTPPIMALATRHLYVTGMMSMAAVAIASGGLVHFLRLTRPVPVVAGLAVGFCALMTASSFVEYVVSHPYGTESLSDTFQLAIAQLWTTEYLEFTLPAFMILVVVPAIGTSIVAKLLAKNKTVTRSTSMSEPRS